MISGGTPPTKNTVSLGSRSNKESVPGASPFWMNFCSSVKLWLGMVRNTFPCRPSLQEQKNNKKSGELLNENCENLSETS